MKPDSLSPSPWRVRVFAEDGRAGNPVAVTLLQAAPSATAAAPPGARLAAAEARCLAWPTPAGLAVRCEQNGVPIRCCGHGLLAAAWTWHRCHAASLPEGTMSLLVNGEQVLRCAVSGSRAWLQLPRPCIVPVPLPATGSPFPGLHGPSSPDWRAPAAAAVTAAPLPRPIAAAESGDADGYRILEYAPTLPLDALELAYDAIAGHDGRALILTQRSTDPRYDYLIRYAAPRYGNAEDAATGSGNAIAATYWNQRLQRSHLTGLQTPALPSPQPGLRAGGVLHTRFADGHVLIGGELILPARL